MMESCAQRSSEDNSREGLRQSYFKVGHAAALPDVFEFRSAAPYSEMGAEVL